MNDSAFLCSSALNSASRVLSAGRYDPSWHAETDGGLEQIGYEGYVLASTIGRSIASIRGEDGKEPPSRWVTRIVAGCVWSGLEALSIPFHTQEMLAAVRCASDDIDLHDEADLMVSVFRAMGHEGRARNFTLLNAGLIVDIADHGDISPSEAIRDLRSVLSETVEPADWDMDQL